MYMDRDLYQVYCKLSPRMLTKSELLALIPDVQPRNAWKIIETAYRGKNADAQDEATMEWSCDLSNRHVSPLLARVVVRLFDQGLIPQARKSSSKDIQGLRAYAATASVFLEAVTQARHQRQVYLDRVAAVAEDFSLGRSDEITWSFIDDIVIRRKGLGFGASFEIDGVQCHKVRRGGRLSNSGKSRDPVFFDIYWIDRDGIRHGDADSEEVLNRRNDPERNWGLGRE